MKKYLLPLIGLLFTVSAQAASFTDGKEYITPKTRRFRPSCAEVFLILLSFLLSVR